MYRNYIFDLYGTLVDIRTDEESPVLWEKMSEIYAAFGAEYEPGQLRETFRRLEREEAAKRPEAYAEIDLTQVLEELYRRKNADCDRRLARMTAVVFRTLSRSRLELYPGVTALLEELRKRGRGVYLLSNAQADFTRPEIRLLGLEPYFDGIFLSSEQGVKKPSPAFFQKLLETYGLDAGESVMIGNDEEADIAGALRVGMDALYIHTAISPGETGRVEATYRVMDGNFEKIGELLL